jgi:hypothetical protein
MLACMVSSECVLERRMLLLLLPLLPLVILEAAVAVAVLEVEVKADDGAHADTL